jgi:F-type H+-transporting ATPase subunit delta
MKTTTQMRRQAKQLYRLCFVNGMLDEGRVRQVVQRVIQSKRRGYLTLLARFQRLVKLDFARHTANVESAMPLTADVQATVEAGLKNAYGPGVNAVFAHNPTLIGGIRIKLDSDVYDGSVRAGLASLERRF